MKRKRFFIFGAFLLAVGLGWWIYPKPDRFFSDLSMNVPAQFIVSPHSPFMLRSMEDRLILEIPNFQVSRVQKIFAAQKEFKNVSANLPRNWANFRAGEEELFPKVCPKRFQAGQFTALDEEQNDYFCTFLFDQDKVGFTTLYLRSTSPID